MFLVCFLGSPGSVFVIQVVFVMLEMVRNTDIVVTTVKGQFMSQEASYEALLL